MNKILFSNSKRIITDFMGSVVIIPTSGTKASLFEELSRLIFADFFTGNICVEIKDWCDIPVFFHNLQKKTNRNLCIFHESICGIIPTWDIAMYLSSVDEFIKEPDKKFKYHISFAFNDVEKEEIIKYYPGNLNTVNENNSTEQRNHWNRKYLKEMLDKNGIPENDYSLWNEFFHDTITLYDNSNALWEIIYMDEKGNKSLLKVCPTEDAACRCLYDYFVNGKSL